MAEKIERKCEICGKPVIRYPSQMRKAVLCSKECSNIWCSRRLSNYNQTENPMNTPRAGSPKPPTQRPTQKRKTREAVEKKTREQIHEEKRLQMLKGHDYKHDTYMKLYGRHEHRVVAEQMLGRPLAPGEIVHHKNGDRRDNRPENLEVMTQSEHASLHFKEWWRQRKAQKGGDAA